ncbi:hypothetical protein GCM10022224_090970 [Nonomuraea antimicrobica]|uniref:CU044_5270 family protein n=1 Tax=Nonomuraea antimicrobica TaxID=561173 RepID=A0ABP7DX71_9ACTN
MNPVDDLRAVRPAHLGDRPVDEHTRSAELARAMAGPRQALRRRTAVRPVWGISLAGAAAAVTAVAVIVSGNGPAPDPRAPDGGPRIAPSATPDVTASTTPKVKLSAREVLLAAAEEADRQPDGSGAYWHSASARRTLYVAKHGGYVVEQRSRTETWTPRALKGEQWFRSQTLGARPATEADRKAWERAGSPPEIKVAIPGNKMKLSVALPTAARPARTERSPVANGQVFWLGRNVTMKDLRGLPSDPDKLKKWLAKSYDGHDTESDSVPMAQDTWLFRVSVGLITDMPVTPAVRGAAFRMLADLDDVEVIENVTDAQGRHGTAVAVEERSKEFGVLQSRLVFDESSSRALAIESVVVRPGTTQIGLEPGTVWNSTALIESGWTNSKPS